MRQHNSYTPGQLSFLKENYKTMDRSELTEAFNKKFEQDRTLNAIHGTCKRNKFKSGRTGYFPPGNKPWSTGTKGICKPNASSFQKGNRPANWKPVGHERIDRDGYTLIKVEEPNVFKFKHRVLWEKEHGEIPDGFLIAFIDGDKSNFDDIANLELISKQENVRRNKMQISTAPEPVKETMKLIAKLQVATADKRKLK